jgi:hypothetical protein
LTSTNHGDISSGSDVHRDSESEVRSSDVLARLGLKAGALAWPFVALALEIFKPSRQPWLWLGFGLAWPEPWLIMANT